MIPADSNRGAYASATAAGGISTGGAVAVLFLALKLCHVIDWPWLWVLAPFWIPVCLVVLLLIGLACAAVVAAGIEHREREQRYRKRVGGIQPNEHGPARRWPR